MTERQVGVNQSLRGTVTLTSLPSVPLPTHCTYPYNIYSISIHNIYTVSTQYLHCIYYCIFSPGTVTLTSLLSVLVVEGRRASCTSPSHHQPTPRISSQLLTVVTSPPSSLGLSKPGSSCTPEPRDDCTDKTLDMVILI